MLCIEFKRPQVLELYLKLERNLELELPQLTLELPELAFELPERKKYPWGILLFIFFWITRPG